MSIKSLPERQQRGRAFLTTAISLGEGRQTHEGGHTATYWRRLCVRASQTRSHIPWLRWESSLSGQCPIISSKPGFKLFQACLRTQRSNFLTIHFTGNLPRHKIAHQKLTQLSLYINKQESTPLNLKSSYSPTSRLMPNSPGSSTAPRP